MRSGLLAFRLRVASACFSALANTYAANLSGLCSVYVALQGRSVRARLLSACPYAASLNVHACLPNTYRPQTALSSTLRPYEARAARKLRASLGAEVVR